MAITELLVTKIYVVDSITASLPPAAKDRIVYEKTTKKLKIYNATSSAWEAIAADNVIYAANASALTAITGAFDGQIGIDGEKNQLYVWSNSAWQATSGGGSITLVANKEALPADADAGDIAITKDNGVLWYYDTAWTASADLYSNEDPCTVALGGIALNTTFSAMTMKDMFDALLYKEVNPTINQPSVSLAANGFTNNGSYEVGSSVSCGLNTTLNKGTITPVYNEQGKKVAASAAWAGDATSYVFEGAITGTKTVGTDAEATATTCNLAQQPITKTWAAQTFKVTVNYAAGPYDSYSSKGNKVATNAAGNKVSNTLTIKGALPVYATTSDITKLTRQSSMVINGDGNIQLGQGKNAQFVSEDVAGNKQAILVPATWFTGSTFTMQQYDTSTSQWKNVTGFSIKPVTVNWGDKTVTGGAKDKTIDGNAPADTAQEYKYIEWTGDTIGARAVKFIK
jgi:hypothetical protein